MDAGGFAEGLCTTPVACKLLEDAGVVFEGADRIGADAVFDC